MKRILLLAALAMAVPAPAHATHTFLNLGFGTTSCGEWTDKRAMRNDDGIGGVAWLFRSAWIQGYLTASQTTFPEIYDQIKETDAEGIAAWVDNYCHARPLDDLEKAADALVNELLAKYYEQHPPSRRKHG